MKTTLYLEYAETKVNQHEFVKAAKAAWVNAGHKVGEIETLNLYVKPEDSAVYVVINDDYQTILSIEA